VDVAREHGAEVGLVAADSAVARPDCSVGQLRATAARLSDWRGARAAGRVASMADPRSESAAESRFRYLWYLAGGPELDLQVEVTSGGVVIARLDALDLDGNTAHEVDGRVKYDGEDGRDVVWQEKLRQDAIQRVGLAVERWVWADGRAARTYGRSDARRVAGRPRLARHGLIAAIGLSVGRRVRSQSRSRAQPEPQPEPPSRSRRRWPPRGARAEPRTSTPRHHQADGAITRRQRLVKPPRGW
jgi:hypothetical protein